MSCISAIAHESAKQGISARRAEGRKRSGGRSREQCAEAGLAPAADAGTVALLKGKARGSCLGTQEKRERKTASPRYFVTNEHISEYERLTIVL